MFLRRTWTVPWLVWLSWLGVIPQSEGLLVWFPLRAYAYIVGLLPGWGVCERQPIDVSLLYRGFSPSLSPPFPFWRINKWIFKKPWTWTICKYFKIYRFLVKIWILGFSFLRKLWPQWAHIWFFVAIINWNWVGDASYRWGISSSIHHCYHLVPHLFTCLAHRGIYSYFIESAVLGLSFLC